jgi:hypothetical protein
MEMGSGPPACAWRWPGRWCTTWRAVVTISRNGMRPRMMRSGWPGRRTRPRSRPRDVRLRLDLSAGETAEQRINFVLVENLAQAPNPWGMPVSLPAGQDGSKSSYRSEPALATSAGPVVGGFIAIVCRQERRSFRAGLPGSRVQSCGSAQAQSVPSRPERGGPMAAMAARTRGPIQLPGQQVEQGATRGEARGSGGSAPTVRASRPR